MTSRREVFKLFAGLAGAVMFAPFLKFAKASTARRALSHDEKTGTELEKVSRKMPRGIELYEIGGIRQFPIYNDNSGLAFAMATYLITRPKKRGGLGGDNYYTQTIRHNLEATPERIAEDTLAAVPVFLANLAMGKATKEIA